MTNELREIIVNSEFSIAEGKYVYAKAEIVPENIADHFMVSYDNDEITVVTKEENLKNLSIIERNKDNYKLFAINVSIPFYCVGFLAKISEAIAKEGLNVLVVSTYSKDCLLIEESCSDKVKEILLSLGMAQSKS